MAEKIEKEKKTTTKTATTRAKAPAKAASTRTAPAAKAVAKAPAKAAVTARPVGKRTVARKRAAPPAGAPGEKEEFTGRRFPRKTEVGGVGSAKMAETKIGGVRGFPEHPPYKKMIRPG